MSGDPSDGPKQKNYSLLFHGGTSFYKIEDPEQYENYTDSRENICSRLNTAGLLPVGYRSEVCTIRRDTDQQVPDDVTVNNNFTNNRDLWNVF